MSGLWTSWFLSVAHAMHCKEIDVIQKRKPIGNMWQYVSLGSLNKTMNIVETNYVWKHYAVLHINRLDQV